MILLLPVSIIWLAFESGLIYCKEISETSSSLLNNELEPCYHAERLLRSGISPDLVIRTLEATGQMVKGFPEENPSTATHTFHAPHVFRKSFQMTGSKVVPSKIRQSDDLSKQTASATTKADLSTPYPITTPDDYIVSPDVKLVNKLKNEERSEINTLTDVVANTAGLTQENPVEISLDANKYKNSDVNLQLTDLEISVNADLLPGKKKDEEPESDILQRKASSTSHSSGLCDEFVARGIRGRNNLLSHLFTRNAAKKAGDKKSSNHVRNQGNVVIKSKALNGKNSNIRNVKDVVVGDANLRESFNILDIMDDDDFKDSKVSEKELYLYTSASLGL
ncbi:uncharacterized protein LOC141850867 [Brevipalpus obovatus]|uniref:uncharacterized protein LOC141850867 n=1 Tax=Brevipalpus obovatus TaxID=246614 RepID=UPI003D9F37A8